MKIKYKITLDPEVEAGVNDKTIKTRKHPGVVHLPTIRLPDKLKNAMLKVGHTKNTVF